MSKISLRRKVASAAERVLSKQRYVSFVDIVCELGWIHPVNVDSWRKGRLKTLDQLLPVPPDRALQACEFLVEWAREQGLRPHEVDYLAAARDRRQLTFLADGTPESERILRTHWYSPQLPEAKQERLTQQQSKAPDLVVVSPLKDWTCAGCDGTGAFLFMENDAPLCLDCADMGHLVFLPAGNAALSRRAKAASGLAAVVVRFNRSRKHYQRQGILVEQTALEQAEEQCLADAEVRERRRERDRERRAIEDLDFQTRFAEGIRGLFPRCPTDRAEAIARHAGLRGSGRVGRSAAGRALDENAITLAVVASVRHADTGYDQLLMSGVPREEARTRVEPDIDRVLESWRGD